MEQPHNVYKNLRRMQCTRIQCNERQKLNLLAFTNTSEMQGSLKYSCL